DWQTQMDQGGGWNALFWNNHDQPFVLNRFGDPVNYRVRSAQMLAATIHLLRGTPYIYMGEELGMIDPTYTTINDYVDIEALNAYKDLLAQGHSEKEAFAIVLAKARDNSRTPMHWDDGEFAGFSNVEPWLMPTGQDKINVEVELESGAIFNFYQKLIALRKQERLISEGHFKLQLADDKQVFAFERYLDDSNDKLLVLNNFYGTKTTVKLTDLAGKAGKVLLSNYDRDLTNWPDTITLNPYETLAFKV
ncbi:MAG: alpha-glucosidase C-terminal domain-containing protein, partial [Ligilactobacillus sp.]|nr:alpha-glucosidase C-terminal domain-containing protein [Ligilactobacillus sp.]